jgi:hypothetical protein
MEEDLQEIVNASVRSGLEEWLQKQAAQPSPQEIEHQKQYRLRAIESQLRRIYGGLLGRTTARPGSNAEDRSK